MPIGNTGGGGGGITLLASNTLSAPGTFDFQSIPQGLNDLLVVAICRGTRAAVNDGLTLVVNNDNAAANYQGLLENKTNAAALSEANVNAGTQAFWELNNSMPAANAPANVFGTSEMWIYGYTATTWNKEAFWLDWGNYNPGTNRAIDWGAWQWTSTAAINRLTIQGQTTANLATGSQVRIYGR